MLATSSGASLRSQASPACVLPQQPGLRLSLPRGPSPQPRPPPFLGGSFPAGGLFPAGVPLVVNRHPYSLMRYAAPVDALSTSSLTVSMPSSASPFELLPSPVLSTPLAGFGTGPCPAGPAPPPTPFIAVVGSVAAAAFPAGSTLLRPSRLDPPSLWPDRAFLAGSVTVVAFPVRSVVPLLFCRERGLYDWSTSVRCCRPPWQGSLTSGRSKKQDGRPVGALLLCRPTDR
jgi:hypothetical protein